MEFRQAMSGDAEAIFQLIVRRVEWMEQKGLRQWNQNGYLEAYPLDYFHQHIGDFWVAIQGKRIVAAAALLDQDENWPADQPAFYLHNLVSDPDCSGAGGALLDFVEALARRQGKVALRLDSDINNRQLGQYYEKRGFLPQGQCSDGPYYTGIMREKAL